MKITHAWTLGAVLLQSWVGGIESFLAHPKTTVANASNREPTCAKRFQLRDTERSDETVENQGRIAAAEGSDEIMTNKNDSSKDFEVQTRNPLRWLVLRLGLTEPAMTSPFNYGKYDGIFRCAYCGQELFDSNAKYDSGSGWPSFWRSAKENAISYKREMDGRLECKCQRCSSHLGHVFLDGPAAKTVPSDVLDESPSSDPRGRSEFAPLPRFCINGAAMTFEARETVDA